MNQQKKATNNLNKIKLVNYGFTPNELGEESLINNEYTE